MTLPKLPSLKGIAVRPAFWLGIASLLLWLLAGVLSGRYTTSFIILNGTLATFLALAGIAQMVVITGGDGAVDLSIGYLITCSAFVSATLMGSSHNSVAFAVLVTLALGVASGVVNGFLITVLRIPAIIATLAVGYILYSVALVLNGRSNLAIDPKLESFVHTKWAGIPLLILITLAIGAVIAVLLYRTVFGARLHAVGQSRRASAYAGIGVRRIAWTSFVLSGFIGAIVGMLLSGFSGGAFISMGDIYVLGSVGAVVVGGTPVSGGRSSVLGTLLGALVITLLVSDLAISGMSAGGQDIAEGIVIIGIVIASGWTSRRQDASS
jgi:ribose transport system permease protein